MASGNPRTARLQNPLTNTLHGLITHHVQQEKQLKKLDKEILGTHY